MCDLGTGKLSVLAQQHLRRLGASLHDKGSSLDPSVGVGRKRRGSTGAGGEGADVKRKKKAKADDGRAVDKGTASSSGADSSSIASWPGCGLPEPAAQLGLCVFPPDCTYALLPNAPIKPINGSPISEPSSSSGSDGSSSSGQQQQQEQEGEPSRSSTEQQQNPTLPALDDSGMPIPVQVTAPSLADLLSKRFRPPVLCDIRFCGHLCAAKASGLSSPSAASDHSDVDAGPVPDAKGAPIEMSSSTSSLDASSSSLASSTASISESQSVPLFCLSEVPDKAHSLIPFNDICFGAGDSLIPLSSSFRVVASAHDHSDLVAVSTAPHDNPMVLVIARLQQEEGQSWRCGGVTLKPQPKPNKGSSVAKRDIVQSSDGIEGNQEGKGEDAHEMDVCDDETESKEATKVERGSGEVMDSGESGDTLDSDGASARGVATENAAVTPQKPAGDDAGAMAVEECDEGGQRSEGDKDTREELKGMDAMDNDDASGSSYDSARPSTATDDGGKHLQVLSKPCVTVTHLEEFLALLVPQHPTTVLDIGELFENASELFPSSSTNVSNAPVTVDSSEGGEAGIGDSQRSRLETVRVRSGFENTRVLFSPRMPVARLPPSISELSQLHTLNLSGAMLTALPAEISNLASLEYLLLSDNQLERTCDIQLPRLRVLDLACNSIVVAPSIRGCGSLRYFSIAYNAISNLEDDYFTGCARLEHIDIEGNSLPRVPKSVYKCRKLSVLNVRNNIVKSITNDISSLRSSLQRLYLDQNKLRSFPASVAQLKMLRSLYIGSNSIHMVPEEINLMKALRVLDLSCLSLTSLPASFSRLGRLESLSLRRNSFKALPPVVCELKRLVSLDASHMMRISIPPAITQLTTLQRLMLRETWIKDLPSLMPLQRISELDFSLNHVGTIPEPLLELKKVRALELSYNALASVPDLTGMTALRYLDLSHNKLSALPQFFTELQELRLLDVSCNKIGTMVHQVKKLSQLKTLSFGYNKLSVSEKKSLKKLYT